MPISDYGTGTGVYAKTVNVNGVTANFMRSGNTMNWWTAENWCKAKEMTLANADDLGCSYFSENSTTGACNSAGTPGKEGAVLAALYAGNWTDSTGSWLSDIYAPSPCLMSLVYFNISSVYFGNRDRVEFSAG